MNIPPAKVRSKVRWTTGVFFFVSGLVITTWTSRIPEIQQKFQLSNSELGWVLFAINAGLVCALPFTSWVISRYTSSLMMTISAIVYVLLLPAIGITSSLPVLVFLLFCFGAVRTFQSMSANTNALEVQQLYDLPVIAKFHGIWSLACFVGVGTGALMISKAVHPLVHFSGMAIIVIILILLFKRKRKPNKSAMEKRPFFVKPTPYLLILGFITFFSMSCESAMFDWSINYFDKVIKADKSLVAAGYTAFIIMFTIGRLVGDRLIARFGSTTMLAVNGILMTIGFLIAVLFPTVWLASAGFLLVGFGGSIVVPLVYSLAGQTKAMLPTYAIVSVTMLGYVGFLTCPLLMGALSQKWGMRSAFGLMALYATAITLLVLLLRNYQDE
jgi:fucose permease